MRSIRINDEVTRVMRFENRPEANGNREEKLKLDLEVEEQEIVVFTILH